MVFTTYRHFKTSLIFSQITVYYSTTASNSTMNLMRRLWRLPRLNLGFSRRVRYITLVGARFHFFMIDDPLLLDWRPCCWCVVRHVRQPLMPNSNRDTYIARRAAYNDDWCAWFVLRWGVTIQVGLGWRRSPCQRRQRTPPIYCALQWKVKLYKTKLDAS